MKTNLTYNDKIIQEVADIIREAGPQNLATVVGEIKQLLEQLFQNSGSDLDPATSKDQL